MAGLISGTLFIHEQGIFTFLIFLVDESGHVFDLSHQSTPLGSENVLTMFTCSAKKKSVGNNGCKCQDNVTTMGRLIIYMEFGNNSLLNLTNILI